MWLIGIFELMVLRLGCKGGDLFQAYNWQVLCVCILVSMQEGDTLEHSNVKCHLCAL